MTGKILVAFASRNGSTEGVAAAIAGELRSLGESVDVRRMAEITSLENYKAVIAGSAIQGYQWLPEAMEFVKKHRQALSERPFATFMVCMTLAMKKAEKYQSFAETWLEPVRTLVKPVQEGYFAGALKVKNVPTFSDRLKFRISILLGFWKEGDHRDWDAIRKWSIELYNVLLNKSRINSRE